jgi:phosphonoacetate hydrolase
MAMNKFIIVGFDALRRDLVTSDNMPNLAKFVANGCNFINSRATFPTETRVNSTSLSTGTHPQMHGIVANTFFSPALSELHPFKTDRLNSDTRVTGQDLVTATSLGELLAKAGMHCATISAGTSGNGHLLNSHARRLGHTTFSVQGSYSCSPAVLYEDMVKKFGPVPAGAVPNFQRCTYVTDVLLDHILPQFSPDVATIWFSEPDLSFHYRGIGSPESIAAMRAVDNEFGRILDWRDSQSEGESIQIFAISDHGQVTARKRLDIISKLSDAGFRAGKSLMPGVDFVGVSGNSGNIFALGGKVEELHEMVDWLREQHWIGNLFTRGKNAVEGEIEGTFSQDLVNIAHDRTPHLVYTLKADDTRNEFGVRGSSYYWADAVPEILGGVHGGLHPMELNNFMAAEGNYFLSQTSNQEPCGIIDIAPTILSAFGLEKPDSMLGRVLSEALNSPQSVSPPAQDQEFATGKGDYTQTLSISRKHGASYLNGGWRT